MAEKVADHVRLDTEVKVKKTRASKPKVKTGCQTCKIRRVKCDETKPSCMRCVRFGHQCDGYSNKSPSKSGSSSKSSRTLVPKSPTQSPLSPSTSSATAFSPVSSCSAAKLYPSPPRNLFQTQHEHEAFQTFCSRTSYQLSSAFSSDLWTRLMVQACETEPSIRHAVIAIGALNLTAPLPGPESSVGTLKHNFAFRQYSKALCLLRRDVAGGMCDLRTTLIACLLFYCFESFHGYHELAISQVYSGLKLIREWTTSYYKPDDNGRRRTRIGSEDPYTVEDDILRAFSNLEIQVMTYADGRSREAHEHYRHIGQEAIDDMPPVFGSLQEARTLLELVIRRSMHWLRSTMRLQNFSNPSGSPSGSPTWGDASESHPFSLFFDVDPTFEERLKTMEEYEHWDDAFRPLLNRSRSRSAPEEDFLLASTLRLHWLSGYLSIASNNSYSSLVNNGRFTTELEELVGISRILLGRGEELGNNGGFVFDMQIIVPLMTVGWIYRHRALRREAIELLLRSPRKEGVWDGIVVGKIMAWLAGIEEEGLDDEASEEDEDYVPEWAAARCIKMSFDTERREASVSCLQPVRGSLNGEEVRREVIIPW
ncbi:hypothetical protein L207DRAFT_538384 [Hyaloscypha variabilis F]|uniref:Zn(2)-C6 fungal-type domain-containing protein n=1 Tax=Hyaloscypha variabilis (strain UAMH 11265 / GT02V1 / F) TaxID=1149755 RepID=A0A2J6QUI8_HYAVF|nr:hypothetical protein L207DRAFT_538384 [Hyaloscypha variabilis F]